MIKFELKKIFNIKIVLVITINIIMVNRRKI